MSEYEYKFDDEFFLVEMLHRGYDIYVAKDKLASVKHNLIQEFTMKSAILENVFQRMSIYDFLAEVFPGVDKFMVITSGDGEGAGTYREYELDDLVDYQSTRNDVYVPPCSFINGYCSNATCRKIYALVIDIDQVKPHAIEKVIKNGVLGSKIPMPTLITNSGSGLHFYYVLRQPVPYFRKNRPMLQDVYRGLFVAVKKNLAGKADWHSLIQPFRLPGSLTKLDQEATGFSSGSKWDIKKLAVRVGATFDGAMVQLEELSQEEYNKRQRERLIGEKCPLCGEDLVKRTRSDGKIFVGCMGYPKCRYMRTLEGELIKPSKTRKPRKRINGKFYDVCLRNVWERTEQGRRYLSMVGLAIVAYKTGVSRKKLEEDLNELVEHFNEIGAKFKQSEVNKALKAYNPKAITTRSTVLEDYFGWEFRRKGEWIEEERKKHYEKEQERVHKLRPDIKKKLIDLEAINENEEIINKKKYALYWARKKRDRNQEECGTRWNDNSGRKTKQELVLKWREEHPDGRKVDCIKETGISKATVYKWWESGPQNCD